MIRKQLKQRRVEELEKFRDLSRVIIIHKNETGIEITAILCNIVLMLICLTYNIQDLKNDWKRMKGSSHVIIHIPSLGNRNYESV